ncbi:MAG: HutD family protein [Rhizobacter sp.]|nr:HutD family protein [Bacteriovorax sp.]
MIEIFKKSDFKSMPWRNGGGLTTELYLLPGLSSESFLFRLSRAEVSIDGPFSIFPDIDRILLLIEGNGFDLKSELRKVELNKKLVPLTFKGEEVFSCALLDGPCVDFNIMTDRSYANTTISVIHPPAGTVMNFTASCDLKFIYDIGNEKLYKLEKNDQYNLEVSKGSSLIVVEINRK